MNYVVKNACDRLAHSSHTWMYVLQYNDTVAGMNRMSSKETKLLSDKQSVVIAATRCHCDSRASVYSHLCSDGCLPWPRERKCRCQRQRPRHADGCKLHPGRYSISAVQHIRTMLFVDLFIQPRSLAQPAERCTLAVAVCLSLAMYDIAR